MNARDNQRAKVYSMGFNVTTKLTLEECEKLIIKAHTAYGLGWTGRIHHGGGTRSARGGAHYINLPLWARTPETVLHEAAHSIHQKLPPALTREQAHHGPEFTRIWMNLLCMEKLTTAPAFRVQARTKGVKVSPNAAFDRPPARDVARVAELKGRLAALAREKETLSSELASARVKLFAHWGLTPSGQIG